MKREDSGAKIRQQESEEDIQFRSEQGTEARDPAENQGDRVGEDPVGRVVVEELDVGEELIPSQEPVPDVVGTDQWGPGRSSLVRGSWCQEMRRNRNSSECASEVPAGDYAKKPCSRDEWEVGMGVNLDNNFVEGREGRSWGRNDEGREQGWAYGRTLLRWWDERTYRTTHTDKPGSIGKGSCEQFLGEADYQCLGLPTNAVGNTAWRLQGRAAADRDSNRRPVEGSTP